MLLRLVFFILISPLFSLASIQDWNQDRISFAITDGCRKIDPEVILKSKLELDKYRAGIYPSIEFNRLLGDLSRASFKLSIESTFTEKDNWVDYIRQNPGYRSAIAECSKTSKTVAYHMDQAIVKTKTKGQVLAAVVLFGIARGGTLVWSRLGVIAKKTLGLLSTAAISAWAYSLFNDVNKSNQMTQQLENVCGPKTHPDFSKCVGDELVSRIDKLEKNLTQTDQTADTAKAHVKKMVEQQIAILNKRLQQESSPSAKKEISAQLKDRTELLKELN